MKKIRVGILFGGRSGEHEVSLQSARSVIQALDPDRYDVVPIGISKQGYWLVEGDPMSRLLSQANRNLLKPADAPERSRDSNQADRASRSLMPQDGVLEPLDVIFPILHGPFGEDGTIQGLLELAQVPYVGCGVLASAAGMDKILFKDVMIAHGIPTVSYLGVFRRQIQSAPAMVIEKSASFLGWPVFCKPANLGSSVGISLCRNPRDLEHGLILAAGYDHRVLIEKAVPDAREIEVSVLGNDQPLASVPGEIIPSREFYNYQAKYLDDGDRASKLIIPALLNSDQEKQCRELAVRAFRAIDGSGMSRVDFLMDGTSGELFLNELNTIPGFTAISMYAKLWEATGISYRELIDRLIELAIERFEDRKSNRSEYLED
ncbi:D-alanine--D-alanine ligase [bacterium]|nr:D-alanine--D-alanine ligase [candidate division CSSED10-310 bacterium]